MSWTRGACLITLVLAMFPTIGLPSERLEILVAAALLGVATLVLMTTAAWLEFGVGYAIRHLVLATVLLPMLLIGIILVPLMVRSDVVKSRGK